MNWNVEVVDSVTQPGGASVLLDSEGAPHVFYQDITKTIYHAWKEAGVWTKETAASDTTYPGGWWIRYFSAAIGNDVLHVVWATGGYTHFGSPVWPNVPVVGDAVQIHHAYSAVGSGSWTEEVIWTGDADDAAGYWTTDGFGAHFWTWTAQHSTYVHGVAVAADSSGFAHVALGYEYQGNVPSSGTHQSIYYLNGADGWSVTDVMTDTDVESSGGGCGFVYAATHPICCDVNDDIHLIWLHYSNTVWKLEYAKSTDWAITAFVNLASYDDWYDIEPISVAADSDGNAYVFYVNADGFAWSAKHTYVAPIGGASEDVGLAYTGNLVLTDDVPYIAFTTSSAANITYSRPISGTWTPESIAPANNAGYVDLAQAATAPVVPHVTWCMSILGKVMYASPGGIYFGATMF